MKKTFKVVMLPTEKAMNQLNKGMISIDELNKKLHIIKEFHQMPKHGGEVDWVKNEEGNYIGTQHKIGMLYVLSDEEIKEGEWCLSKLNEVVQFKKNYTSDLYKKIVATTDKSLLQPQINRDFSYSLPQLPESFIQAYIKAYNEGKPITEIDLEVLECEKHEECDGSFNKSCGGIKVKTREDNTVIVHPTSINSKYPYRVGRKQGRAVLSVTGHEQVLFPVGKEKEAQEYCDFLNSEIYTKEEVIKIMKDLFYEANQPQDGFYENYTSIEDYIEKNL